MRKLKLIRATTIPQSLNSLCRGMLKELSDTYEVIALSSPDAILEEISRREGVRTIAVPMERHIHIFKDFKSLVFMIHTFRKECPDIVHSMTPKAGLLCMIAGWITNVPVRIHTFTGLIFPTSTGLKRHILMLTDKITCACATHVIPEGEGVKQDLIENDITKKPLKVLGYGNVKGVDMEYFTPFHITHKKFTFLYVGRIAKDKGITELVTAFSCLKNHSQLIIVGPIDNSDPIQETTMRDITQSENIHLVPATPDVRPYYNRADCVVLPSYREGFPNVVLEAGAMGLPCIVTDINGSREIISDHINGLIVSPHNIVQLRDAMKYLINHPEETKQMGKNARPNIANKFEQSFVRKCLYNFYKETTQSYNKKSVNHYEKNNSIIIQY